MRKSVKYFTGSLIVLFALLVFDYNVRVKRIKPSRLAIQNMKQPEVVEPKIVLNNNRTLVKVSEKLFDPKAEDDIKSLSIDILAESPSDYSRQTLENFIQNSDPNQSETQKLLKLKAAEALDNMKVIK